MAEVIFMGVGEVGKESPDYMIRQEAGRYSRHPLSAIVLSGNDDLMLRTEPLKLGKTRLRAVM